MSTPFKQISAIEFQSSERLFLASDLKTIVKDGDPRAASLLVPKGGTISVKRAERLGITEKTSVDDGKPVNKTASTSDVEPRTTRVEKPLTR